MNFVAVVVVSAIVLGHPLNKRVVFIGLNSILLCLNNSSQIGKNIYMISEAAICWSFNQRI